jgi:hypothetical protein
VVVLQLETTATIYAYLYNVCSLTHISVNGTRVTLTAQLVLLTTLPSDFLELPYNNTASHCAKLAKPGH